MENEENKQQINNKKIVQQNQQNPVILIQMRKVKESSQRNANQQALSHDINQLDSSVVVIKYIQPARELLESNNFTNCVYKKQLNYLPYIFKCCEQLHPLASDNSNDANFSFDPSLTINLYKRDLSLKINPFQTKTYFRSTTSQHKSKFPRQTPRFEKSDLEFDSHFQSGNLLSVDKEVMAERYHLMMQNDINTYGCTQWFFFRAFNKTNSKATFFINNFYKPDSLYKKGMKIIIFSMKKYLNEEVGWVRGGQEIGYFPNKMSERQENTGTVKQFYTLKFSYNFQYQDDEVYFAYNYPYTYSKLNSFLGTMQLKCHTSYNCRTLCKTAAENKIYLITITNNAIPKHKKHSIFITSRVHPGETVSSLMMEGIIQFLVSGNQVARILREKFIFKIVPMLNPDGVIHGNYRTNLAGIDLNRVWDTADKILAPEIFELKKYIIQFNKQCPVIMFCDLHGHSARKSAFIYGCQNQKLKLVEADEESRLFPFMLSFENEDFLYKACNFKVQKSKKGTARIQLWKQLKIPNIFTLEASFCSSEKSEYHFRPTDYSDIGVSFCKTIHEYFLNSEMKQQFYEKLKLAKDLFNKKNDSDEDSESDNDLLDRKTVNQLKNGQPLEGLWERRKLTIEKPVVTNPEQSKQKTPAPRKRRFTLERTKITSKTEKSPELKTTVITLTSKKTIVSSIPTKRLTLDTEAMKSSEPKGYLKRSIFQKVQQNYRGKSTVYRIQKKNIKNLNMEQYRKHSSILDMDSSLDFY